MLALNTVNILERSKGTPMMQGVLCYETALGYHSLCSFPTHIINIKKRGNLGLRTYLVNVYAEKELDLRHTIEINDGLYVTDVSRTICEMIKDDRDEHHLLEALYYLDGDYPVDLFELAKEYGVLGGLNDLISEVDSYFRY